MGRLTFVSAFAVGVLWLTATSAWSRPTPDCWAGYSYAGVQSSVEGYGVSANLKMSAEPVVSAGHVAAWVGVGGAGLGPNGADEWLQAGIARDAGGQDVLYYEFKRPGDGAATFVTLGPAFPDATHSIVMYERAHERESWRVMVDGTRVSPSISLPGSHGRFEPVATAENWDGGVTGACNDYTFSFTDLAVRTQYAATWQAFSLLRVLRDPAYQLSLRASGFVASSR